MAKRLHGHVIFPLVVISVLIVGLFSISIPVDGTNGSLGAQGKHPLGARYVHAAAVVNSKVYVFGGCNSSNALDLVQEYIPGYRVWTVKSHLSAARYAWPPCGL